jgi:type IV secretory pathway VirB10-like protein
VRTRLLSVLTGAALVLSLTTACQATPPDLAADQAKTFQSRVLAITTSVADGGYAAALESLTALETELDAAAADGSITFSRHQRIEAALFAVRADIETAIAAPEPEPAPVEPTAPVEEEEVTPEPDTETDAEKKAREAAEKKAEEAQKKADEAAKKAAEKAAEEEKKAAEEAEKAKEEAEQEIESNGDAPSSNSGKGND